MTYKRENTWYFKFCLLIVGILFAVMFTKEELEVMKEGLEWFRVQAQTTGERDER